MSVFENLGRALRWLRDQRRKKQYEVAEAAGITKGMLCAYETGKQRPSLDTLEKLLAALGCGLLELHDALALVNGRVAPVGGPARQVPLGPASPELAAGAYPVPGGGDELAESAADPLGEMVRGFHHLVRHLQEALQRLPAPPPEAPSGSGRRGEPDERRGR